MLIKKIEVSNFRSIRREALECESLTILIGRNGAGKSSFLKALDVFYDVAASITEEDFFNRDTSVPIEICVTFGDLSLAETEEFAPYVRDGSLTITKRITLQDGNRAEQRYYAATPQIPEFARIRGLSSKTERRQAWQELVQAGSLPELSGSPRSADEVDELMAAYERDHPELRQIIEREVQFFGARNIGGGKLDKYTKFVLVPAVREAADEVGGKKGAIQQILDTLVLRKLASREDVQAFQREFEERARELFGPATESELEGVADSLSRSLADFAPGSSLKLRWGDVSVPDVQPPAARVTLVEDEFEGDIERKGHGLQRALVLTLLRELALLPPSPLEGAGMAADAEGESPEALPGAPAMPDLILAIEEPELFLHPSRCRYLNQLLAQLTAPDGVPRNQVICSTHSPHFVTLRCFDQIRRIEKIRSNGRVVPETVVRRFSLQEAAERLAHICEADVASFTRESFAARALPLMTHTVNEGFFADVAVLVEGPSEMAALWTLQDILNEGWDERGIVVIPVGGKTNLDRPTVIFQGLGVPTYVVFDADRKHRGTRDEETTKKINRICLRLVGAALAEVPGSEFPETQVQDTWAVFEGDIEGVLESELGEDALTALLQEVAPEFGFAASKEALKNVQVMARVLELAYSQQVRTPTLEKIVGRVGRLSPGKLGRRAVRR